MSFSNFDSDRGKDSELSEPKWIEDFRRNNRFGEIPDDYAMCCFSDGGCLVLPIKALKECFHSGSCDSNVKDWEPKIDWSLGDMDIESMIGEIEDYGGWSNEELYDEERCRKIILWLAAGNYADG